MVFHILIFCFFCIVYTFSNVNANDDKLLANEKKEKTEIVPTLTSCGGDPTGIKFSSDALDLCLSRHKAVFAEGNFRFNRTIKGINVRIYGASAPGGTTFIGDESIPVNDPLLALGKSSVLSDIDIGYDKRAISGKEDRGERVCLAAVSNGYPLARGASISGRFYNCGTAISNMGANVYSASFPRINIIGHSYAGVDFYGGYRTSNLWGIVIVNGNDAYPRPKFGFNYSGEEHGGDIRQLNVENQKYAEAAVRFSGIPGVNIGAMNVEEVDSIVPGKGYIELNQSSVNIGTVSVLFTRMSQDYTYIFKLLDAKYTEGMTYVADRSRKSVVKIENYITTGLANPAVVMQPKWPESRRFISKIIGFEHFHRPKKFTDSNYELYVGNHSWGVYPDEVKSGVVPYMEYAWERYSNFNKNITLKQWGSKGDSIHPRKNFIYNGDFEKWVNDSFQSINNIDAVETAVNAYIFSLNGAVLARKILSGYNQDSDYCLKISNLGAPGKSQGVFWKIPDWRKLIGREVTISFEAKAANSGKGLEALEIVLDNVGGEPDSISTSIIDSYSPKMDLKSEWQYYKFTFIIDSEGKVKVFGNNPFYKIQFYINKNNNDIENEIYIKNIKLEIGSDASSFS